MSNLNINRLPDEIIRKISLYIKCINYRNGKYIYRISENDPRYEILKTIKRPNVFIADSSILYVFNRINLHYRFNYLRKNTKIHIEKYQPGLLRGSYLRRVSYEEYLIDENGICIKL